MTVRIPLLLLLALPLAACASDSGGGAARPGFGVAYRPSQPPPHVTDTVIGQTQASLTKLFGAPDAQVSEGVGRKLQYKSGICVLDAYLYPSAGGSVATVTHVDTRQASGAPIDEASCIAALRRRGGGK